MDEPGYFAAYKIFRYKNNVFITNIHKFSHQHRTDQVSLINSYNNFIPVIRRKIRNILLKGKMINTFRNLGPVEFKKSETKSA